MGDILHIEHAWIIWSVFILILWHYIFLLNPDFRKEMLLMSFLTMPLGLTEPFFVPEYWNPPSLFDLAQKTGFDIESLVFSFAIGGIGSVIYKVAFGRFSVPLPEHEKKHKRHRLHRWVLFSPVVFFLALALVTDLGHIYCALLAMFIGAMATLFCRPDLKGKIWLGGLLFTFLYFVYFESLLIFYPDYVNLYWNLDALTGILLLGIPIEEYLFAFTFGLFWSSLYEHVFWQGLAKPSKA